MATTIGSKISVIGISDAEQVPINPDSELSIFVIFTSIKRTLKALEKAREIAGPLGARIVVTAVQVVPFPLPLDEPPVPMEFVIRRFEEIASEITAEVKVSAYLCRNPMQALKHIIPHHSPVVIGIRKSWWPSREERLARKMLRAGFNMTLVKTE